MKAFLNDACDLLTNEGETVEIMLHKCECFQADIVENQSEYEELDIYYNLDELSIWRSLQNPLKSSVPTGSSVAPC